MIAVGLDKFAPGGHAVQLFQQHAAFPASAEAQFAHQLLVPGALAGGTFNAVEELAVSHSGYLGADLPKSRQGPCLC
jgi:hypothetical protein